MIRDNNTRKKEKTKQNKFHYFIYLSNTISKSISKPYLANTLNTPPPIPPRPPPNFNALIPIQSAITRAAIKVTKRSIIRARRQPTPAPGQLIDNTTEQFAWSGQGDGDPCQASVWPWNNPIRYLFREIREINWAENASRPFHGCAGVNSSLRLPLSAYAPPINISSAMEHWKPIMRAPLPFPLSRYRCRLDSRSNLFIRMVLR